MSNRDDVFARARADRSYAATVARDMVRRATTTPQFKPGLGAVMRKASPYASICAFVAIYDRVDQNDAEALYALAAIVRDHALTWAEIDGN